MKRLAVLLALIGTPALAAPFAHGNAAAGKALEKEKCAACHAGRFDGDSGKIYTRADRRVKSADGLAQQIGGCNSMLGLNLFPEDEANLGAFLNQTYYKFK
ncbi:MAG TPA: cytochrome c [Thiobacillaceae bacterium]|nr:cytochrome c [Thiobacillaceae bacterium]HNU63132.1 cytochrome c [Thiobacillaceae bacterium]